MVLLHNKISPIEAAPPPFAQTPPTTGAGTNTQMSPRNQSQKRPGKRQFQHPPPGYNMATMNFIAQSQFPVNFTPLQFPPVTSPPHQLPPVNLESAQGPPEGFNFGQQPPAGFLPQQQPPVVDMSMQQYSGMSFGFQQGPQEFPLQQGFPPMEFMPPQVMFDIQAQFMSAPIYAPESNVLPFNGTVPPPGFEPRMALAAENPNYQYDANNTPVVNGQFNEQFSPGSPHFLNIPMQPFPLFIPSEKLPNQRRPKAIAIIDPATGMDKLNEIYGTPKVEHESKQSCEIDKRS